MAQGAGYSFNSATVSGSTVRDLAGYFLHGTITGSAAIAAAGGKYGDGLNCTGGAMQVSVEPSTYPLDTSGGLGVAAWVKLNTTLAATRCIASAKDNAGTLVWALYASNATGNVEAVVGGTTYTTTTSIRDAAWHHVILSVDAGGTTVFTKIAVDGVEVFNVATAPTFSYSTAGNATMEVGRLVTSSAAALDGVVDDVRWFNDPIDSTYWSTLTTVEQIDNQMGVYYFDADDGVDSSGYGRHLSTGTGASFTDGPYGRALVSTTTAAGLSAAITYPDFDRLSVTGWLRIDTLPGTGSAPILALTGAAGETKLRCVVNADATLTWTAVTDSYGTFSVTSPAMTVGKWTRVLLQMNPTYIGITFDGATYPQTATGNSIPHLTPTVSGCRNLYLGGDATAGAAVTWNYVVLTKNFIANYSTEYWKGGASNPLVTRKPVQLPQGVWDFNENTGTTAADASPNARTMTMTVNGRWIVGVEGSAMGTTEGTGSGGSAKTATFTGWPSTPYGWGFSMWVKVFAQLTGARFLCMRGPSGDVLHAGRLSGTFWVRYYNSTGSTSGILNTTKGPIAQDTWTHVAAAYDGYSVRTWINGKSVTVFSSALSTPRVPNEIIVGGDFDSTDSTVAHVDDFRLYAHPLSSVQVQWLYANTGSALYYGGLGVPTNLTATPAGPNQINLAWTAGTGATSYDIERDGTVAVTGVTATSYSDTGLSPSTTYTYRVRSVN